MQSSSLTFHLSDAYAPSANCSPLQPVCLFKKLRRKSLLFFREILNKTLQSSVFFKQFYPCAAVKSTVSLQVWRQHCSPFPPKKRAFSEAKTFESWSLATPRSKSLVILSLCHNSTSRGNLKQRSDLSHAAKWKRKLLIQKNLMF